MDCEDIIERVGSFGLYQKVLGAFLCLLIAPFFAFNDLTQFLLFLEPNHSCVNPSEEVVLFYDVLWFVATDTRTASANQCHLTDAYGNRTECLYGHQYNYSYIYPTIVSEVSLDSLPITGLIDCIRRTIGFVTSRGSYSSSTPSIGPDLCSGFTSSEAYQTSRSLLDS